MEFEKFIYIDNSFRGFQGHIQQTLNALICLYFLIAITADARSGWPCIEQ